MQDIIERVKDLIARREAIEAELATIFGNAPPATKRSILCKNCGQEGHNKRSCPHPPKDTKTEDD